MSLYEILNTSYYFDNDCGILYRISNGKKIKLTPTGSSKQVVIKGKRYKLAELVYLLGHPEYEIGTKRILAVDYTYPTIDSVVAKEYVTIHNYKQYYAYDISNNVFVNLLSWKGEKTAGSYVKETLNASGSPTVVLDKDSEVLKATLIWHWFTGEYINDSTSRFVFIDGDYLNTRITNLILNTCNSVLSNNISPIRLAYLFNYSKDGAITPKYRAEFFHTQGYTVTSLFNHTVGIHRILYALYHNEYLELKNPTYEIDHIDHNRQNNSIINLRKIPSNLNKRNKSLHSNNTSGYNGIQVNGNKFRVEIASVYLGLYDTLESAITARDAYTSANNYHSNHGKDV